MSKEKLTDDEKLIWCAMFAAVSVVLANKQPMTIVDLADKAAVEADMTIKAIRRGFKIEDFSLFELDIKQDKGETRE